MCQYAKIIESTLLLKVQINLNRKNFHLINNESSPQNGDLFKEALNILLYRGQNKIISFKIKELKYYMYLHYYSSYNERPIYKYDEYLNGD